MSQKVLPHNANIPWLAVFEFPSHADADAFAKLVEENFGDKALVRKKNAHFNQGAFTNWRTTKKIRAALAGRSFDAPMVGEVLINAGYAGTANSAQSWLTRAMLAGVIQRLKPGIYEFTKEELPVQLTASPYLDGQVERRT